MAIADTQRTAPPVPWAVEYPDRIPKERYYDPEFFARESELLWPRVWQMACRLDEIPQAGDVVEYEILDQSIIVVRTDDVNVRAYYNACRHRGTKLVEGYASRPSGLTCPFHGWCYGLDGSNTFVLEPGLFSEHSRRSEDLNLTSVRCELWGGCAWINLDDDAPPLRDCIEPFASIHDSWKVESLHSEWWMSCRLPVNWKLAMEAFLEGYHARETHPQLFPRGTFREGSFFSDLVKADGSRVPSYAARSSGSGDVRAMVDGYIRQMRLLSDGMAGMTHANDVRIAEGLRDLELPDDPEQAMRTWRATLNDAIVKWYRAAGCDIPDLNELDRKGIAEPIGFCFPHYFLLPTYSSASAYRVRPLGPEETLFEIWSLTRCPAEREPERATPPEPMTPDDPRWPLIPSQDFANLPKQQKGLHAKGFKFMRLSDKIEGSISNFERVVDGYLAGLPYEQLTPALRQTNTAINVPIADVGF